MADRYMGNPAISGDSYWVGDVTFILLEVPTPISGTLYKVDIYDNDVAGDIKIKVWRDVPPDYVMLSSEIVTLTTDGLQTFTLVTPVRLKKGDLLGGTTTAAMVGSIDLWLTGGNSARINADVGTTAKASFGLDPYLISMYGYIKPIVGGFSGVSEPWIFMKDMWEKHNKIFRPKGILIPEGV